MCIDPHQTGFICKGSEHLQLIKFWTSRALRKGLYGGAKFFGSALLQPAPSVCVSSERFFILLDLHIRNVALVACANASLHVVSLFTVIKVDSVLLRLGEDCLRQLLTH